ENQVKGIQQNRFEILFNPYLTGYDTNFSNPYIHVQTTESGIQILSSQNDPIQSIALYDLQGQLIYNGDNINSIEWLIEIPIHYNTYIINVVTGKGTLNTKIRR
ncbi:T9SS type A sorting domain-containing protein, partial [Bacteroidales bacterium OttesenSCG-928-M06]|nr:T9SS type A sorting domain-containing protein [Bacteroidales bacterium OttesenSCG-928-M06]